MGRKKIDPDKPLPSHTKLDYWECYAKIILETFYPNQFHDLVIADKPDLRTPDNVIGIEVTSAIPKEQREAVELWSKIPYADDNMAAWYKKRMEQLGEPYQGGIQFWPEQNYSADDIRDTPINDVLVAFSEKVEKLNGGGYAELQQYCLFIHSEVWLVEEYIFSFLKELISLNSRSQKYYYVFLTTTENFFRFDLNHEIYSAISCEKFSQLQGDMSCKARKMVEEGEKDDEA